MKPGNFTATNYRMGTPVTKITFFAHSPAEAVRIASRRLTAANGLPGTGRNAGSASCVIGVKRV